MVDEFAYKPSVYPTIDRGVKSRNKYVKAIANMLLQYDKKVEEVRMDMRIKNVRDWLRLSLAARRRGPCKV